MGEQGGDNKRIRACRYYIGGLNVKLLPVSVDPATLICANVVQGDDRMGSEKRVRQETHNSANTVLGKNIQRIVHAEVEFD
jgi:hypothetical protein